MIKLTIKASAKPDVYIFHKSTILIGSASAEVDLSLPIPDLKPIHLKIIEHQGSIQVINAANDPFVSINGYPFGKKFLKPNDQVLVHDITLSVECVDSSNESMTAHALMSYEESNISTPPITQGLSSKDDAPFFDFSIPFESEVDILPDQDFRSVDIDNYLKTLEQSDSYKQTEEPKKISSLKDDYLKDLDDDHQPDRFSPQANEQDSNRHLYQAWRWILFFIFSMVTISVIIGTVIYLSVSDKTEAQETKVSQGLADISMALIHAQTNHVRPHNQNWSDIDFLKNNLQAILPQVSSYAAEIDSKGQFTCCPYSLRIYTSNDLSRFLIIAQPAPSLLQWLIPKSAVIVDSQAMELRTMKDLKNLNRLLANANPLEGLNGKEIRALIDQGDLIQLATLAKDSGYLDFAPPIDLKDTYPGAENLIYNAPRYYRLGHVLLQKATLLATAKGSAQEVTSLRQMIENFSCLNQWVIYSDQGKKSALLARQGMMTFAPSDKMIYGYLTLNAQGKLHQAHLIAAEELQDPIPSLALKEDDKTIALNTNPSTTESKAATTQEDNQKTIDVNHPLYIQLKALAQVRENELQPIASAINSLMQEHMRHPKANFQNEFDRLIEQYQTLDNKRKQAIQESLRILYRQYSDMPITQFILFVKEVGFEDLIINEQAFAIEDEACRQNLETMLTHIENSKSLVDLDHLMQMANSWLTFEHIQNPRELIKYQTLLRNKILQQLEKFIIYYRKYPFLSTLKTQDKEFLEHILNCEGIIHPDERDFFLEEFDYLLAEDDLIGIK